MRLEKPLPDAVYRELLELEVQADELAMDLDVENNEDAIARRLERIRNGVAGMIRASEDAKNR